MKKISKYLLLSLLTLSLIGCAGGNNENNNNQSSSTQESNPAKPSKTAWSKEELELQKQYLNGNTVPFFDLSGGSWQYDEYYDTICFVKSKCEDNSWIKTFMNAFLNDGYIENSDEFEDSNVWHRYAVKDLANKEMHEYIQIEATRHMKSRDFYGVVTYHIDNRNYESDKVNKAVKEVFNKDINIPSPTFEFSDWYYESSSIGGFVSIYFVGDNHVADYQKTLQEAGWSTAYDDLLHFDYHIDPSETVRIWTTYEYGETYIQILNN